MSPPIFETVEPISSGEIHVLDAERASDVEQKHRRVADFLIAHRYDALLLQRPENFAWFTSGGDAIRAGSPDSAAALFITPESRVVLCANTDSAQLFDHELPGLGFQLKERPWYESRNVLASDLCRGRNVASDNGFPATSDISVHLLSMRLPLSLLEQRRMRELGGAVTHAVEATARHLAAGETESEIAGALAHRLMKRGIVPERIQVCGDGRGIRHRHWGFGTQPVEQYCTLSAVGRRNGLCVGAARTVCFGDAINKVRGAHYRAILVQATGMYFSQADWEVFEVWNRVERIFEKFGYPDEWRQADQADVMGYDACEVPIVPKSEFRLSPGTAIYWHPSLGPSMVGDTIMVAEGGFQLLTALESWPSLCVEVKGMPVELPDILSRPAAPPAE